MFQPLGNQTPRQAILDTDPLLCLDRYLSPGPWIKGLIPRIRWWYWEEVEPLRVGSSGRSLGRWGHALERQPPPCSLCFLATVISLAQSHAPSSLPSRILTRDLNAMGSNPHRLEPTKLSQNKPSLFICWLSQVFAIVTESWLTHPWKESNENSGKFGWQWGA
jgi:hypothetical protein